MLFELLWTFYPPSCFFFFFLSSHLKAAMIHMYFKHDLYLFFFGGKMLSLTLETYSITVLA